MFLIYLFIFFFSNEKGNRVHFGRNCTQRARGPWWISFRGWSSAVSIFDVCFEYGWLLVIIDIFENRMGIGRRGRSRIFLSLVRASKTWANIVMAIQRGYRLLMSLHHFSFFFFFSFSFSWSHSARAYACPSAFPPRNIIVPRFSRTKISLVEFLKDNHLIDRFLNSFSTRFRSRKRKIEFIQQQGN